MKENTALTPGDIRTKTFSSRWRGLSPVEVKAFLERLADLVATQQQRLEQLQQELERREQELVGFKKREQLLKDTLINAQQVIEAMKSNAQKEGELIIHEAEIKAEKILQETFQRQARLKDDLNELQRLRTALRLEVQGLLDRFQRQLQELDAAGTAPE